MEVICRCSVHLLATDFKRPWPAVMWDIALQHDGSWWLLNCLCSFPQDVSCFIMSSTLDPSGRLPAKPDLQRQQQIYQPAQLKLRRYAEDLFHIKPADCSPLIYIRAGFSNGLQG